MGAHKDNKRKGVFVEEGAKWQRDTTAGRVAARRA